VPPLLYTRFDEELAASNTEFNLLFKPAKTDCSSERTFSKLHFATGRAISIRCTVLDDRDSALAKRSIHGTTDAGSSLSESKDFFFTVTLREDLWQEVALGSGFKGGTFIGVSKSQWARLRCSRVSM
jgi:hypothetical protein